MRRPFAARRGSRRARAPGCGASVDVAGRRAGPAAVRLRSRASVRRRPAPRHRRRRATPVRRSFRARGRSRLVRRNDTGQRADAQHPDAATGTRVSLTHLGSLALRRGASVDEGAIVGARRRERYARGRRAVRPSRDPSRRATRTATSIRSRFLPPRPAPRRPRAAGPSRHVPAAATEPPPAVAQAPAAATPVQEQPVVAQPSPAPPSSSGPPSSPVGAPPSAEPDDPVEPEVAPGSRHATTATSEPAGRDPAAVGASRSLARASSLDRRWPRLRRPSTARDRRPQAPVRSARVHAAVQAQLGARTAVREMPSASEPGRAADASTVPLRRAPRSLPELHVRPAAGLRGVPSLVVALPLVALLVALAGLVLLRVRLRSAPTIDGDALLRDDTHLLRELDADAGSRVHDDRGGHPRRAITASVGTRPTS